MDSMHCMIKHSSESEGETHPGKKKKGKYPIKTS